MTRILSAAMDLPYANPEHSEVSSFTLILSATKDPVKVGACSHEGFFAVAVLRLDAQQSAGSFLAKVFFFSFRSE